MPGWIAGAGAAIGGIASFLGQKSTNESNQNLNAANMAWQTQMSNTAMQRRVQDLRKAGLNPLLAVGEGGASTPGFSPIPMQNPYGGAPQTAANITNAMQLGTQAAQVRLLQAQADKTSAEAGALTMGPHDAPTTMAQFRARVEAENINSQLGLNNAQAANVSASTNNLLALRPKLEAEATSAQSEASVSQAMASARLEFQKIAVELSKSQLPEARAQAEFFKSLGALGSQGSQGMFKLGLQALMTLFGPRAGGGVLYNK